MKKILDLTHCNTTEEICNALEQEIANNEKPLSLKARVTNWFKHLFHK